ncbi:hypothetical protein SLEP1_g25238 [Rubroshorea leprosula]|uniref:Uncharacterized protein n=1 Tax=Rubroshorea leprosula TaxID=152421 RepID=A0AAV5JRZ9_9ROSI|nr:hypothetical protein SLEP1_g25238 [Rubroshorea leprosula]
MAKCKGRKKIIQGRKYPVELQKGRIWTLEKGGFYLGRGGTNSNVVWWDVVAVDWLE